MYTQYCEIVMSNEVRLAVSIFDVPTQIYI
jgi:hypothetical protein